jgi:hypothetical protein
MGVKREVYNFLHHCDKFRSQTIIYFLPGAYKMERRKLGPSGIPRNFFRKGSANSFEDRGQRERRSGGGSPLFRVPLNLQTSELRIVIRLLRMYFPRNWKFGSALPKFRSFGGDLNTPTPLDTPLVGPPRAFKLIFGVKIFYFPHPFILNDCLKTMKGGGGGIKQIIVYF